MAIEELIINHEITKKLHHARLWEKISVVMYYMKDVLV